MQRTIEFTLNGRPARVKTEDGRMLLWVLRSDLGLTGAKYGCGAGLCGACSVLLDGEVVRACSTPIRDAAGKQVITIEGLSRDGRLHPIQEAFLKHHAFQCGFCTPGMILSTLQLLQQNPDPTEDEIRHGISGNLCRCGSHPRIVAAIEEALHAAG